jgi:hypothetical protein
MPRYYRPTPDYSRLYGKSPEFILDAALQNRTFGQDIRNYEVRANENVLRIFGDATVLTLAELKDRVDAARESRVWSSEFCLDFIGNAIAWGIHLGFVERLGEDRSDRSYRLLYREPVFEIIGGKAMRVLGLPAAEQIAMNVRRSRLWALRATLARKRAAKVRKEASFRIDRLIAADRDAPIPEVLHAFLGEFIVGLSDEVTVGDVRELLLDAHNDWEPKVQDGWISALSEATYAAEHEAYTRAKREAEEVILPEDLDAFAGI